VFNRSNRLSKFSKTNVNVSHIVMLLSYDICVKQQSIIYIPFCQHKQQAAATVSDETQWQSAEMTASVTNTQTKHSTATNLIIHKTADNSNKYNGPHFTYL